MVALGSKSPKKNGRKGSDLAGRIMHVREVLSDLILPGRRGGIEAANTSRLNRAHWKNATAAEINEYLENQVITIWNRGTYEAINNPLIEGIINTHATDVVGEDGPHLRVRTGDNDETLDKLIETIWSDWWSDPSADGMVSGAEMLHGWMHEMWTFGEFLAVLVNDTDAAGSGPRLRLHTLSPRRLWSPAGRFGDTDTVLGVERNTYGRPTRYYIDDVVAGSTRLAMVQQRPHKPANVIHGFRKCFAGQARGLPWLTSALQSVADLRDYDVQVMDAARMMADQAVLLQNTDPAANPIVLEGSIDIERRMMTALPPGYAAKALNPTQPSLRYLDFRRERQGDAGRGVGMPTMIIRRDSSDHNYSSARFDAGGYQRQNRTIQRWLERSLNRLVGLVVREAMLSIGRPFVLSESMLRWTWPIPPHVDPLKEGKSTTEKLRNGTGSIGEECARGGLDPFEIIEEEAAIEKARAEKGLPSLFAALRSTSALMLAPPPNDDDEDDDENTTKPKDDDKDETPPPPVPTSTDDD